MNIIVIIIGWLMVAVGLLGIVSPHSMIEMVIGWPTVVRFYLAVMTRIALGILFIFAARRCRLPWLIRVIGVIALVAGIVLFFLGAGRVDEIVRWFAARSELCIRSTYIATTLFGVLLVYAGAKRR